MYEIEHSLLYCIELITMYCRL